MCQGDGRWKMRAREGWARAELGAAQLHDPRRTERLVDLATVLGQAPDAPLPAATRSRARLQAAQRFFTNAAIDPTAIRAPHQAATAARMAAHPVVLAVQDTTELDLSAFPTLTGAGPLRTRRQHGLVLHTTLAVTPPTATAAAVPLGLLDQQVWARDSATFGQQPDHKTRPITEKESHKWLEGLAAAGQVATQTPALRSTSVVVVGDRESDVYDVFLAPRPATVHLLVRAAYERKLADTDTTLWATVATASVLARTTVAVPAKAGRPARTAAVTVRVQAVTLHPPRHRAREHLPPVTVWAVWVQEPHPPADTPALDWKLLTTWPVPDGATALQVVQWYTGRWTIEDWHRVLKTGCAIEARQFARADDFIRCLTLYSILAWRVLFATRTVRTTPDVPCTAVLTADEWQALVCVRDQTPTPPATPPTLGEAVAFLAQRGGFQPRPGRHPGPQTLWRGLQWLAGATDAYRALARHLHHSVPGLSPPARL